MRGWVVILVSAKVRLIYDRPPGKEGGHPVSAAGFRREAARSLAPTTCHIGVNNYLSCFFQDASNLLVMKGYPLFDRAISLVYVLMFVGFGCSLSASVPADSLSRKIESSLTISGYAKYLQSTLLVGGGFAGVPDALLDQFLGNSIHDHLIHTRLNAVLRIGSLPVSSPSPPHQSLQSPGRALNEAVPGRVQRFDTIHADFQNLLPDV